MTTQDGTTTTTSFGDLTTSLKGTDGVNGARLSVVITVSAEAYGTVRCQVFDGAWFSELASWVYGGKNPLSLIVSRGWEGEW